MLSDLSTRKYGFFQLLGIGWEVFTTRFTAIAVITLIVYVPVNILLSLIPADRMIAEQGIRGFRLYMQLIRLSEGFIGILATMAIARIVEQQVQGQDLSPTDALGSACSRWLSAIGTGILSRLIIFGLLLLLIVPGIMWMIYYAFVDYVVILKRIGGKRALDYSKRLARGQWWRVFGILFGVGLLGLVCGLTLAFPFGLFGDNQMVGIVSDTLIDISGAYFQCVLILFFLNVDALKQSTVERPET